MDGSNQIDLPSLRLLEVMDIDDLDEEDEEEITLDWSWKYVMICLFLPLGA